MSKQEETTYNIRISSNIERNPITNYDKELSNCGFTFQERKTAYSSFYEKKNATPLDVNIWEDWAKRHRFVFHCVDTKYTRNEDYRKEYFQNNKPVQPAKYRCVYCGRKLLYKDVTVDHLYPVNKLMYSTRIQKQAKRYGVDGANDVKNLVCACRSCNSKKGTKTGFWLLRGKIGRHPIVWKIRNLAVGCLVAFCVYTLWVNGYFSGPQTHVFGTSPVNF